MRWGLCVAALAAIAAASSEVGCRGCEDGGCGAESSEEDRRLLEGGPLYLAASHTGVVRGGEVAARRLAAPFSGSPPAEIALASLGVPQSSSFLQEAALLDAVVAEINADPTLLPNTTFKGFVISEGYNIKDMLEGADEAHLRLKACLSVGLLNGQRQGLMAAVAKVRNTNHGIYKDSTLGTMPRFEEYGTTFGVLGWSTIIASFLDMVGSLEPGMDRFALILPESYIPFAERFEAEQKLRGIAVVYKMLYDYRRVDVDATFEDADAYAKQIIDGVVAAKGNLIFNCFCSTNNRWFRIQLFRHAIKAGLFNAGFQWFTHYTNAINQEIEWLLNPDVSDLWPYLDNWKVVDLADYEPPSYDYAGGYREAQAPEWTDAVLKPKIQPYIDMYNVSLPDRGLKSLALLDCSLPEQQAWLACDPNKKPGHDSERAAKWDVIKHLAWTLHELIYNQGRYDFCDVDATGVRTGDPQLFLDTMRSKAIVGFTGVQRFQPVPVTGGVVLSLPRTWMLTSWVLSKSAHAGGYVATREPLMHVDRFTTDSDPSQRRVMRRNFFTGELVTDITWMGGVTEHPRTWYHDMCGKSGRIDMSRADKDCISCPSGEFNAPRDHEDRCISIANYSCPPGTYLVEAMASGGGLEIPCMPCAEGTFSAGGNVGSCELCHVGTFQPDRGSPSCLECRAVLGADSHFTTRHPGAHDISACVCPEGEYKVGLACLPCPRGMTCPIASDVATPETMPRVDAGHMSLAARPLTVYKCLIEDQCPGGAAGACAPHRDATMVACGECAENAFPDGDQCKDCSESAGLAPLIIAALLALLALAVLLRVASRDAMTQMHSVTHIVVTAGLLMATMQVFGLFSTLSLAWISPLGAIFKWFEIFNFKMDVLQLSCSFPSGPVVVYFYQQLPPFIAAGVLLISILLKKRLWQRSTRIMVEFGNTFGNIVNILFVSILMSNFKPWLCFSHPGGSMSMVTMPSVLCFESGAHASVSAIGIITLLLLPVPFVGYVAFVTLRYRRMVTQFGDFTWLMASRWLFGKYKPEAYYYGSLLLLRSALLCCIPVIFRDQGRMQIFCMTAVLIIFMQLRTRLGPWRSGACNALDAFSSLMLVLLLQGGSNVEETDESAELMMKVAVTTCLLLVLFVSLATIAVFVYRFFKVNPFYDYFVCHHKADAAAQARYLKMSLERISKARVFIDSDHLKDLDVLFDVVRSKIGNLLVYLTRDTLRRPWCCGEIATAWRMKVRCTRVETPGFVAPTDKQLAELDEFVDFSGGSLERFGITIDAMKRALAWFVGSAVSKVALGCRSSGPDRIGRLARQLCSDARDAAAHPASLWRPAVSASGSTASSAVQVAVSADPEDEEAIASASILEVKILAASGVSVVHFMNLHELEAADSLEDSYGKAIKEADGVIVVLSAMTLVCREQLFAVLQAMAHQEGRTLSVATPGFKFPDTGYYSNTLQSLVPEDLRKEVEACMLRFYRLISISMSTGASDQILAVQSQEVLSRLPGKLTKAEKSIKPRNPNLASLILKLNSTMTLHPSCSLDTDAPEAASGREAAEGSETPETKSGEEPVYDV